MPAPVAEDELLQDIRRVHRELGKPPSENDYDEHGDYSSSAVRRELGKYTAGRQVLVEQRSRSTVMYVVR